MSRLPLPRPRRRVAASLAAAALGLVAAGCGSASTAGDPQAGAQLFEGACGQCHTLADAGTESQIGPSLDDAFRAARQDGMSEEQFHGVVRRWIEIAQPPMPRNIVTGEDAEDVAAYVAQVAGTDGEDSPVRPAPPETPAVPDPPRQELNSADDTGG